MIEIRAEEAKDSAAIRQVHLQAFYPRTGEAHLVELLRAAHKMPISWVAVADGQVVGHVVFSPIIIEPSPLVPIRGLGLGPVAVLPAYQNRGIGSELIAQGLKECQQSGYDLVLVLGHPGFYTRFGFTNAKACGLANEYGADDAFMVMELWAGALRGIKGMIKYQPEFNDAGC